MTKSELQVKISELEASLKVNELSQNDLLNKLVDAQKELENINKPIITKQTLNQMQELVQTTLDNYDFNRVEEYEYDFSINYDNRLELDHIEFNNVDEIADQISSELEELFNIKEDEIGARCAALLCGHGRGDLLHRMTVHMPDGAPPIMRCVQKCAQL